MSEPKFDAAILVDAELLLPTDPLIGRELWVYGVWAGVPKKYDSIRAILDDRTAFEANMATVIPDHARPGRLDPPCYVQYNLAELALQVYGQVFTPDEMYQRERVEGAGHREADKVRMRVADAMKRNWLYGWWFSAVEKGEWGAVHRAWIARRVLSIEYEEARAAYGAGDLRHRLEPPR